MGFTCQRVIHDQSIDKRRAFQFINLNIFSLVATLNGHTAELSNCLWNFDQSIIATSSIDATARLWDIRGVRSCHVIDGHRDEVLDICFNYTGKLLATCSNDCTSKIWNVESDFSLISTLTGHTDEVSRIRFNPIGNLVLTASADKTARIWCTENGLCSQILSGHTDEVISCAFNYAGTHYYIIISDHSPSIIRAYVCR